MSSNIDTETEVPPHEVVTWIVSGCAGSILRQLKEAKQDAEHHAVASHALHALCDGMSNMDAEDWARMVRAAKEEWRSRGKEFN